MNKVDRLYNWQSVPNSPIQDAFARQEEYVRKEFDDRLNQARLVLCCVFLSGLGGAWPRGAAQTPWLPRPLTAAEPPWPPSTPRAPCRRSCCN